MSARLPPGSVPVMFLKLLGVSRLRIAFARARSQKAVGPSTSARGRGPGNGTGGGICGTLYYRARSPVAKTTSRSDTHRP